MVMMHQIPATSDSDVLKLSVVSVAPNMEIVFTARHSDGERKDPSAQVLPNCIPPIRFEVLESLPRALASLTPSTSMSADVLISAQHQLHLVPQRKTPSYHKLRPPYHKTECLREAVQSSRQN